jgi:hypothetical protein
VTHTSDTPKAARGGAAGVKKERVGVVVTSQTELHQLCILTRVKEELIRKDIEFVAVFANFPIPVAGAAERLARTSFWKGENRSLSTAKLFDMYFVAPAELCPAGFTEENLLGEIARKEISAILRAKKSNFEEGLFKDTDRDLEFLRSRFESFVTRFATETNSRHDAEASGEPWPTRTVLITDLLDEIGERQRRFVKK